MKNFKKLFAGLTALTLLGSLTACGGGEGGTGDDTGSVSVTTTTQATVAINSETLSSEQEEQLTGAADLLTGELENKTIKWFSFYDTFHAGTSGNTKALSLELFEDKYDGEIEYVETTWQNRFNDMSTKIIGGEGIDFCPGGDLDSFPRGVPSGQFQSFDQYMDWDNPLWAEQKNINDMFTLGSSHYIICTQATAGQIVIYNRATIEAMGMDDPAELFKNGEWTWDTFRSMLLDFCDTEAEQYGLDGWFNEAPIMLTSGVPSLEMKDGKLSHNINDPNLERVMNYMYELNTSGLVLDKSITGWNEHPEYIGEGKELFYICGAYTLESAPDIWTKTYGTQGDVMFVPMPKDPEADKYYLPAGLEAFMLCKGAQNPEGVMRFMECVMAANQDENAQQLAVEKRRDDFGWSDEMIEMQQTIVDMSRENPVYDLRAGGPADLYSVLDSGDGGIRSAFVNGTEWSTIRESLSDLCDVYVNEFNEQVSAME